MVPTSDSTLMTAGAKTASVSSEQKNGTPTKTPQKTSQESDSHIITYFSNNQGKTRLNMIPTK